MPLPSTLITGGNGYVGLRLAESILQNTDHGVQLYIHASSPDELQAKSYPIKQKFESSINNGRLKIISGELSDSAPFSDADSRSITQIVHSAAVTRFNVEEELANRVNIEGSRKLLNFAQTCSNLTAIQFLSTVYASGLRQGTVLESELDRAPEFSNHYERSKWEAEQIAGQQFKNLPVNMVRIATLIADNETGSVTQQNAFHNTLKLFYYGLLSLFPGEKSTPVYFVTGDFVIDSIMSIMSSAKVGKFFHVCHEIQETATLEQLLDTVFETFESYKDFKIRRVLKPLWSDAESFDLLNQGIGSMSSGVMAQAVSSVSPFSRQLFAPKDFRNDNLRAIVPHYSAPHPQQLIASTARYLADTKWGRQLQNAN